VRRGSRIAALLVGALLASGLSVVLAAPASADPDFTATVAAASAYAAGRGQVGISVLDRETGQLYENGDAHTQMRSASVVKIFVAENLLDRARQGTITLSTDDQALMESMVRSSDDDAMSALYSKYGEVQIVADVAQKYGLTEVGAPPTPGYWGMFQITAHDVVTFYEGMLTGGLVPADRDYLLSLMRSATPNGIDGFYQFFGIPDALGSNQTFGVKQGWMCCQEGLHRLHTTGILGPDARFAVAFLSQYTQDQSYAFGGETLTNAVSTVFPGGVVPASGSTRNPVGSFDTTQEITPGTIRATGWALDPDASTQALAVNAYVDGVGAAIGTADVSRPDVGAAYPQAGADHGFSLDVPVGDGPHQLCVYAINVGAGTENTTLGCRSVTGHLSPVGSLDDVSTTDVRGVTLRGWTLDPESPGTALAVHTYVDGVGVAVGTTALPRPDVRAIYPSTSTPGFTTTLTLPGGTHQVCAYGIKAPGTPGGNTTLGCRTVTVPLDVFGSLDAVTGGAGTAAVRGWAIGPDTPGSAVTVHVYLDGVFAGQTTASGTRADVALAYPSAGAPHGFSTTVAAAAGIHTVCTYGLATVVGRDNPLLGCTRVTVG
jgi:hypothetical protein